jgi:hypothetical protein
MALKAVFIESKGEHMEEQKDQYVSFQNLTHKGLAAVVTHMTGTGMAANFTNSEDSRDWARYYASLRTSKQSPVAFRASLKIKGEDKKKEDR